jgi:hypothetical protein
MKLLLFFLTLSLVSIAACNDAKDEDKKKNISHIWPERREDSDSVKKIKTDSLCALLRETLDTLIIKNQVYYLVEGDITLSKEELHDYCYNRLYSTLYDSAGYFKKREINEFTVSTIDGMREVWPQGKKLTYAVLRHSFPDQQSYDSTILYMKDAAADWMTACNIQFEHLHQFDTIPIDADPVDPVVFFVQYYRSSRNYIAKAFFPFDADFLRKVLLQPAFFSPNLTVSRTGILRHELGHVLGARHEHIWSKEEKCKGESVISGFRGAVQLTEYDPYSVMHYLCNRSDTSALKLTDFDKKGIQILYGKK